MNTGTFILSTLSTTTIPLIAIPDSANWWRQSVEKKPVKVHIRYKRPRGHQTHIANRYPEEKLNPSHSRTMNH